MDTLNAREAKSKFVQSIYNWLIHTLIKNGNEQFTDCFQIEGSSIICSLPDNYFNNAIIPTGTKIEMKFISKKS